MPTTRKRSRKSTRACSSTRAWDKQSGYRTTQVLAVPIFHENTLMGVIQIVNRKGGGKFTADEQTLLEEIAEVLGIAFYNQHRVSSRRKTRFDYLVNHNLMKDGDLEAAFTESRRNNEPIDELLMKKYRISREDIGRSMEDYHRCRFVHYNPKHPIPDELLKNLKREFLRRELWVPFERGADGKIRVIVDDPNNMLKKDMIENLLKTKAVEYCVSLKDDIIKFINHFYQTQESEKSFHEILSGEAQLVEDQDEIDENGVSESDSIIMQLVNRIINDGIAQRASDIHIEPNLGPEERRDPLPRRRRLHRLPDGALQLPGRHRLPHQDHVESRHHGAQAPPGRQDQVQAFEQR